VWCSFGCCVLIGLVLALLCSDMLLTAETLTVIGLWHRCSHCGISRDLILC
jgi:predicted RND superfamily exporter protein